jgi:hypothetical protein
MAFPSGAAAADGDHRSAGTDLITGSATAHRNDSLQSRRNKTVAGILEDQSNGYGGA